MVEERLKRSLSPVSVWALALGCIIGWGAFVMPGNTFLPKGGPLGTVLAMAIAAAILIVIAFNYHYMIKRYPVAGGGFIYAQKTFGRTHGFICAWFLGLAYLCIVPLNATALALIGRNLLGGVFQVGFHYNVAGYEVYLGEIILACAALVVFAILGIKNVKASGAFQTVLVFVLVGSVLLVGGAAVMCSGADPSALEPLFSPDVEPMAGILAIVAVAPWAFVGFDTIPQSSEEFNFSARKTKILMVASIIFGAAVYAVLTLVTALAVPEGYATWAEYIAASGTQEGLLALPTFFAAHEFLGMPGVYLLGAAVCCAILSGIVGFYMATSRLFMSMAREGVLPAWFGKLDAVHKTPRNAILVVFGHFADRSALRTHCPRVDCGHVVFGRRHRLWVHVVCRHENCVAEQRLQLCGYRAARRDLQHLLRVLAVGARSRLRLLFGRAAVCMPVGLDCCRSGALPGEWAKDAG